MILGPRLRKPKKISQLKTCAANPVSAPYGTAAGRDIWWTYCHGDVEIAHRLTWLEELHKKIWNRKDRIPQLFNKVKVTQADYTALQERLNELHPGRESLDYRGIWFDVLDAKLEFLRSLPHLDYNDDDDDDPEANNEDSEASNDDEAKIKSLFPFTIHQENRLVVTRDKPW